MKTEYKIKLDSYGIPMTQIDRLDIKPGRSGKG